MRPMSSEEVVRALYKSILKREPEAQGLEAYAAQLDGGDSLENVCRYLLESEEFRQQLHPATHFGHAKELGLGLPTESLIEYRREGEGEAAKVDYSNFYRGEHCNLYPHLSDHRIPDFFTRFALHGHIPSEPIITKRSNVTAFGSCFAIHITKYLSALGFSLSADRAPNIHISQIGDGLVNVYALLSQFEWALEGKAPHEDLWHGPHAKAYPPDENIRKKTEEIFKSTDVFIITLGLSEIWYDEKTGANFWRAVPMKLFDATRHKFRVCSHAETKLAIRRIYELISRHCRADVVFTLSPIPLAATFRAQSCISANSASKAILRSALDEYLREESPARCYYFPSYEIVSELFPSRFLPDGRHPLPYIIDAMMVIFEAFYCEGSKSAADAIHAFNLAQKMSAENVKAWID